MCACVSLLQQLEALGIRHQNILYIIFTSFTKLDYINSAVRNFESVLRFSYKIIAFFFADLDSS